MRTEGILAGNVLYNSECDCPCCQFERENPEPRNRNERRLYKKALGRIMKKSHFVQRAIWIECGEPDGDGGFDDDDENENEEGIAEAMTVIPNKR